MGTKAKQTCASMDLGKAFNVGLLSWGLLAEVLQELGLDGELALDLKHPDLEFNVNVKDDEVYLSFSLLRQGFFLGAKHLHEGGLDQNVCFALAKTADIREGDLVLDPMCGRGTVLLEAKVYWPEARYVGIDLDEEQIAKFRINCADRNLEVIEDATTLDTLDPGTDRRRIHVLLAPPRPQLEAEISDASFGFHQVAERSNLKADVVICDVPFGKQFGNEAENAVSYRQIADLLAHRLNPKSGRFVLLVSVESEEQLLASLLETSLRILERRLIPLGFTDAVILKGVSADASVAVEGPLPQELPKYKKLLSWESSEGRKGWSRFQMEMRPRLVPAAS